MDNCLLTRKNDLTLMNLKKNKKGVRGFKKATSGN